MKHYTIPVFIPELACPFQCIYCDQEKISGQQEIPQPEDVKSIIETHLETIPNAENRIEIGFFGGNFTGIPLSEQEQYLEVARPYFDEGRIQGIRLSTRPDYINMQVLALLKKYGVSSIELGAQSMDEQVLIESARGHTADDTRTAAEMIRKQGFDLGLQMMLGLPGDTLEKAIKTAKQIVALGASHTRIYPALVIRGTKMEEMYHSGAYEPLSMDEAVLWAKEVYKIFEKEEVNVIRMGLHPSEGLMSGNELVAGPFHPSFRELVMTELWWDELQKLIKPGATEENQSIEITVNSSQINVAIGYGAKNKNNLLNYFKKVKFRNDKSLKERDFQYKII